MSVIWTQSIGLTIVYVGHIMSVIWTDYNINQLYTVHTQYAPFGL